MADRNACFDELTASLGDDVPPRVGFDGWQRQGKSGYRACVVSLFNALNDLARSRMLLREALHIGEYFPSHFKCIRSRYPLILCVCLPSPAAASADMTKLQQNSDALRMKEVVDRILPTVKQLFDKRDDWHLSWGGKDLVEHVLHRYIMGR